MGRLQSSPDGLHDCVREELCGCKMWTLLLSQGGWGWEWGWGGGGVEVECVCVGGLDFLGAIFGCGYQSANESSPMLPVDKVDIRETVPAKQ